MQRIDGLMGLWYGTNGFKVEKSMTFCSCYYYSKNRMIFKQKHNVSFLIAAVDLTQSDRERRMRYGFAKVLGPALACRHSKPQAGCQTIMEWVSCSATVQPSIIIIIQRDGMCVSGDSNRILESGTPMVVRPDIFNGIDFD